MKNFLLATILSLVVIGGIGCIKNAVNPGCTNKLPSSEAAAMQQYATDNGISATIDPGSGIYYQVITPGAGAVPLATSKVFVKYTGRLISSNAIFDQQSDHLLTGWNLNTLIAGWQIGLPIIKEGGKIKLIIPSSLAYGCSGTGPIPGDAVLFFEIELVDIQ